MYLLDNPVLQREMLVNLRTVRAFVLLIGYQVLLAAMVLLAWPEQSRLQANAQAAQQLVDLLFACQFVLVSLLSPSFAAPTISGEKERKTYEMLLASPLKPMAIVLGKLLAAISPLAILILTSLPIVVLCLPLGGVSIYEVLAIYLILMCAVTSFGVLSFAASAWFQRTASALVVSYLMILPLALAGAFFWGTLASLGQTRLFLAVTVLPLPCLIGCAIVLRAIAKRLLHPPDVGSEGKEVVDYQQEMRKSVGLVIHPDRFPDRLFAPSKRDDLMPEGVNPIYDKEMRSEIFAHGTRMLRVVIQVSMGLAIPVMAGCLYLFPWNASWYVAYVLLFNVLVGPVFLAGSITSERERQTLSLLLTTTVTPAQILWGKLLAGLRVSGALTLLLIWPLILAVVMVSYYWQQLPAVLALMGIVALSCLTTAVTAMGCSSLFRKTTQSLMASYLVILFLFAAPPAAQLFSAIRYPDQQELVNTFCFTSPFSTAITGVPLKTHEAQTRRKRPRRSPAYVTQQDQEERLTGSTPTGRWSRVGSYAAFTLIWNALLLMGISRQLKTRRHGAT